MSDEPEEWRAVVGWEGLYEVSSLGRVRSLDRVSIVTRASGMQYPVVQHGITLKPIWAGKGSKGYFRVNLSDSKSGRIKVGHRVHRLVCSAFHGVMDSDFEVAHRDGTRTNNGADNVRWATPVENAADCRLHGTDPAIERNPAFKLSREAVVEIRKLRGIVTQQALADRFEISRGHVGGIQTGRFRRNG